MRRSRLVALLIAVAAATAVGLLLFGRRNPLPAYRTARVERGVVVASVSATGTLNAVTTVQVGSQVSGQIETLYADFNSRVRKGALIARLDPALFEAKVNQARADLDAARASVLNQQAALERAQADVENARAGLAVGRAQTAKAQVAVLDAKRTLDRNTALFADRLIAESDRDTAQANYDSSVAAREAAQQQEQGQAAVIRAAEAAVRVAQAQLRAAQAQVAQKAAALRQAEVDLEHTVIRAPVDGVVVSRNVDVGQTVAASLQAPTLFTIAQDLTRMQVDTSVDEADVGGVRTGQPATFTVDAFPGQTFAGDVVQIRKAPQVVQNVVTYDVVVSAPNPNGVLLPGMTANVRIRLAERENALKVPNAALRFEPAEGAAPARAGGSPTPAAARPAAGRPAAAGSTGRVWVRGADGRLRAVQVRLGLSDGASTEVVEGDLAEGQEVIVGSATAERAPAPAAPPRGPGFRL